MSKLEEDLRFYYLHDKEIEKTGFLDEPDFHQRAETAFADEAHQNVRTILSDDPKEIATFLHLLEQESNRTGSLDEPDFHELAEAAFALENNEEVEKAFFHPKQALEDLSEGCEKLRALLGKTGVEKQWQEALAQIIKGSEYLLAITAVYYKANVLQRILMKHAPLLYVVVYSPTQRRLEERINTVSYIHDFLQLSTLSNPQLPSVHLRRLTYYIKELENDAQHLVHWLKSKIQKNHKRVFIY